MITQDALERTLELQRTDGRRLGTLLVEQGLINETQLTQILSHQLAVPWVSLLHIEFSRQLLNLVPHDVAERYCLVPIYVRHVRNQGETLYVAMDDPTNEDGMKECMAFSGLPVRAMIAPPSDIRNAIRVYYGARARSAPPPAPAQRAQANEPPSRARPVDPPPSSELGAPETARHSEEVSSTPEPLLLTRPALRSGARLVDDAVPAIETSEVDASDMGAIDDELAWEPPRPAARPAEREARGRPEERQIRGRPDEQRSRPTLKVAPSPELLAAAQAAQSAQSAQPAQAAPSERRKTLRPSSAPGPLTPPASEAAPSTEAPPTSSTPAAALLGAVLGRASAARTAAETAAARSAPESAARAAAESAARAAAESAARTAAESAARTAAESAARTAAESAARTAAESAARTAAESAPDHGDEPPSEREVRNIPAPQGRGRRRMVSLTLLDGTTITLPARGTKAQQRQPAPARAAAQSEPPPAPAADDPGLTARDLVSALRAVSHGADASEILGNNVRWEAMFAALLSLLLKKHLIADWEFVDELKKI
ncbi:hypothetical protein SOCE836_031250 [Sorangium cellulosum]|uniref:Type II secretion system protein GspE N-terminal domain-containing protein n=3 Tax=Polyangiaceae TaxID=49 RepID=A0A4P2QME8_SORCE|nr:hypothetical protein SOCE836_031250 [Sorangium cellulosum]WCQ90390.1 hypothetical protein NQZ70_03094 [Sorangium sp. Soce836]